ncbi:XTP/dITP diphosphatase [Evansella sp. AB-rgal1]|uniref:XTP/dITP diphosphatase n=1 Tax=Evansella sp. AB-rgal1 TaxID=3242696 RepID=UPI00359D7381
MSELFIATKNKGKVAEFETFFAEMKIEVKSLLDLNEEIDVVEDGLTFEENAMKKAEEIGKKIGFPVLADDSGLEVDALDGAPGIYSARYAGEGKNDEENMNKLLEELSGVEKDQRTARFVCVLAIYIPGKPTKTIRGTCEGIIAKEQKGEYGFGYDPVFYLPEHGKMMAELEKTEKNTISHRANALIKLKEQWANWF